MKLCTVKVLSSLLLAVSAACAQAEDKQNGNLEGVLDITGSLHRSPCVLEMTSAHQIVELNNVPRNRLLRPGDMAPAVPFQLRFLDCRRVAGSVRDTRTGNRTWNPNDPVLSVAFIAPADVNDPRLIKVQGVTGVGLRLTDPMGRDARLGSRGEPLMLAQGNDTLTWHVHPTRTSAPLTNGAFRAVVDFRLNYD